MSNHKWNKDTCTVCGITREKKARTHYGIPYSKLSRNGVWYDVTPETIKFEYCYNENGTWTFLRPDCKKQKV